MSDHGEDSSAHRHVDWWWVTGGAALVGVVAVALATRWDAITASHPAYLVTLLIVAAGGTLLLWRGRRRTPAAGAGRLVAGRIVLVLGVLLISGFVLAFRPAGATLPAIAALEDGDGVVVTSSATRIELTPTGARRSAGLVFYPGGLVDPRAYARVLRPVAEAGFPVVIVKPPLGFAFLAQGTAGAIAAERGEGIRWIVGGHSLGGVAAAGAARGDAALRGLLLWAAFPATSVADRAELLTASIFGSEDGLTTPEDIAASQSDLPEATRFVEVEGAIHAFFGDYGSQPGDGTPAISREAAQEQIVAATIQLLEAASAPPP